MLKIMCLMHIIFFFSSSSNHSLLTDYLTVIKLCQKSNLKMSEIKPNIYGSSHIFAAKYFEP